MLCERCKKNQATVHVKQIVNSEVKELHICNECATEMEYGVFSLQNMFKDLFNLSSTENIFNNKTKVVGCSNCNMSFEEFKEGGKLGCSKCASSFNTVLENSLKTIHGSIEHIGKIPKKSGETMLKKREKELLKRKLAIAIEKEEFEEAAKIRDEIRAMEGRGNNEMV